jgi:hypothetical protein
MSWISTATLLRPRSFPIRAPMDKSNPNLNPSFISTSMSPPFPARASSELTPHISFPRLNCFLLPTLLTLPYLAQTSRNPRSAWCVLPRCTLVHTPPNHQSATKVAKPRLAHSPQALFHEALDADRHGQPWSTAIGTGMLW